MRANYPQVKTETLDGLARLYGRLLPELMAQKPVGLSKLKDPLLAACVSFAVHHEMAQTLEDVILRRLVHGQTGEISAAKIAIIADYMAKQLAWSEDEKQHQCDQVSACLTIATKP